MGWKHFLTIKLRLAAFGAVWVRYEPLSSALQMNKAFTKESDADDEDSAPLPRVADAKNYITPAGYVRLRDELLQLIDEDRPKVVEAVYWAASNGDRSENGDYIYGKKRLREIDRRIRFLTQRLEIAQIVDPSVHHGKTQVFFGCTVTYEDTSGTQTTITILGVDEADTLAGQVSWLSPVATALLKSELGDDVQMLTPEGLQTLSVVNVDYPHPGPSPQIVPSGH